ncbi:unnamed protein product, partial [Iphiclides podalirius]
MDFARKQLEKYGWTAGKGLGKNENGISEALKPKIKRSVTGVGHDLASDFTEHWWNNLYNKAAKNVEVEEVNGKVKKIKCKDKNFEITNNAWQMKKKTKGESSEKQYGDYFVKSAILSNGGSKIENVNKSDSDDEGLIKDIVKITDEELFAACEGRTAHKGARHGLKALGKLARIEQQEKTLLNQAKYNDYSHKSNQKIEVELKKVDSQEEINTIFNNEQVEKKNKKKIRKNIHDEICYEVSVTPTFIKGSIDCSEENSQIKISKLYKKKKRKRKNNSDFAIENNTEVEHNVSKKKKKITSDNLTARRLTRVGKYLALDKLATFFNIIKQNGGIRGSLYKLYRQDELKDGVLVGEDKFGNKYFENPRYFFSRNRWVEYSDKFNMDYDGSQVPAEWFGWLHYKTDLPPHEDPNRPKYKWMLDYNENMSGTTGQFTPYSTTKSKIEPWIPPRKSSV